MLFDLKGPIGVSCTRDSSRTRHIPVSMDKKYEYVFDWLQELSPEEISGFRYTIIMLHFNIIYIHITQNK